MMSQIAGLHVGTIETCSPNEVKVLLDVDAPQDVAFNAGRPQTFPRLNGYTLIPNEGGAVVALISRMTMEPAPNTEDRRNRGEVPFPISRRRLFVTPVGVLELVPATNNDPPHYVLRRGVASYPSVGDAVLLPTEEQLIGIVEAHGDDSRVLIGTAQLALNTPISVDPNKLFGRHLGIFGNTGSGKSCTVAGALRWSVEAAGRINNETNAHIVVLDPNGEYRRCFTDLTDVLDVKVLSVEPEQGEERLTVPSWLWNGQEWAGALDAAPGTQRPVLMQALRHLRNAAIGANGGATGRQSPNTETEARLLFAIQTRAFQEYLQSCRTAGPGEMGAFPKVKGIHANLAGLEDQIAEVLSRVPANNDALRSGLEMQGQPPVIHGAGGQKMVISSSYKMRIM